uniref:neural proliferation differentiation and control protein 1-like isoform X2 n=1 Tax=Styela clava TaxID=7725 RepID=UPI0019392D67|nr:neural proliferation differentiation and control protein 1-like isoform X2 [Styela clava]
MKSHMNWTILLLSTLLIQANGQEPPNENGKTNVNPASVKPQPRQNVDSEQTPTGTPVIPMATIKFKTATTQQPTIPTPAGSYGESNTGQALASLVFIAVVVSICVVGCIAFIGGAYCWYKNNNMSRLAEKTDYPAYGVTGPNPLRQSYNKGPPIDGNLNRSAEVYHYQQQKQKLKAISSASSETSGRSRQSTSDTLNDPITSSDGHDNDEENSDGEYTVYECPGLASTTDEPMEIHNPLFADSESSSLPITNPNTSGGISVSEI